MWPWVTFVITCKTNLAGALIVIPATHVAGASIQTRVRNEAGVCGRVLAIIACEPQGTSARGFPQHGLGHTCPTILAAVLLTGVSMLTIFSQETLRTSVWKREESMKTYDFLLSPKTYKIMQCIQENTRLWTERPKGTTYKTALV